MTKEEAFSAAYAVSELIDLTMSYILPMIEVQEVFGDLAEVSPKVLRDLENMVKPEWLREFGIGKEKATESAFADRLHSGEGNG